MSRTTNRIAITAIATAGLFWAVRLLNPTATPELATVTSPGVPCMDMAQQIATTTPDIAQSLQTAVSALPDALSPPTPAVPAAPVGILPPPAVAAAPVPVAGAVPPALTPALNIPTVPGLPVALPSQLTLPHDLICEDTAWSATAPR